MQRSLIILLVTLLSVILLVSLTHAQRPDQPVPFPRVGPIQAYELPGTNFDEWPTSIAYDDGTPTQWYNGLSNYKLATWFTPESAEWPFELREVSFMLAFSGNVTVSLHPDDGGLPGAAIWSATVPDVAGFVWTSVPISPAQTYNYGEIFWLQVHSSSGAKEVYDADPTDAHSWTWYAPWGPTGWIVSPGDNFIRAVGVYPGIFDLKAQNLSHGENFFNLNPAAMTYDYEIVNQGSNTAPENSVTAYCQLLDQNGSPVAGHNYEYLIPTAIGPGDTYHVPPFMDDIDVNGNYMVECGLVWQWDEISSNNSEQLEFQVYTPPSDWLRYDDGTYLGATYTYNVGDGFGMRFDPQLGTSSYEIGQIEVECVPIFTGGGAEATVKVLPESEGMPDESNPLFVTVISPDMLWNAIDVNVSHAGPFYICYEFNTELTALLCFDGLLKSGQAWMKSGGTWSADPLAYDWCMRSTVSIPPDVWCGIQITSPFPPYIPPEGGTIGYTIFGHNDASMAFEFDLWMGILYPDGFTTYGPDFLTTITVGPDEDFSEDFTFDVPADWPSRRYTLTGYVGDYQTLTEYASESALFYKTVTPGPSYLIYGSETADLKAIPDEFCLFKNYPNPFNPSTNIAFDLPVAGDVTLTVFDVSGRQVATLVDGYLEANRHTVQFDASHLASGVYLYRIEAGNFHAVQKMILLK